MGCILITSFVMESVMSDESTTFGADRRQLAKLWSLGSNAKRVDQDENQVKAELLRDMLASKMPVDQAVAETLPQVLAQLCESIRPFTGGSLGALLSSPETDLLVLKKIKNYTKRLSQRVHSEAEHDVTAMIYYAAIAAALVYHDQRVTSFSYEKLLEAFKSMLESNWTTTELKTLFREALDACAHKTKKGK
jgi:hypothetical protein